MCMPPSSGSYDQTAKVTAPAKPAQKLHIFSSAVKMRLMRAKNKLKKVIPHEEIPA